MDIKAFIFDLDGVIVDTAKYHYLAWCELAERLGFNFSEADNEKLKGISRQESLNILLNIGQLSFDEEYKKVLADRKNERYLSYVKEMSPTEILPGVLEFLKEAKSKGIKIALGSASKNAMIILERLNLTNLFDAIIDGTKVSNAKPDPEVFLNAAKSIGVNPEQCVVFEDADAGVCAAKNAGMYCVGIGARYILGKANVVIPGFSNTSINQIFEQLKLNKN